MKKIALIICFLFVGYGFAQNSSKGKDLVNKDRLKFVNAKGEFSNIEKSKDDNGNLQFLVETKTEPKLYTIVLQKSLLTQKAVKKAQYSYYHLKQKLKHQVQRQEKLKPFLYLNKLKILKEI